MDQLVITRKKLIQLQEENSSLSEHMKKERPLVRNGRIQSREMEMEYVPSYQEAEANSSAEDLEEKGKEGYS